jgi:hypothetical protein
MQIVNWPVLKHPVNWLTVGLMIFVAGLAFHFVLTYLNGGPSVPAGTST